MKNIKLVCKKLLILSITLSILLVVGIVCLVFGSTNLNSGGGWIFIFTIGIILTAICFYGTPICWVIYSEKASLKSLYEIITVDKILNVKTLSNNLNRSERIIANQISKLIKHRYLVGYEFADKKELKPIKIENISKKSVVNKKCPNCGANLKIENKTAVCDYCKTTYEIE